MDLVAKYTVLMVFKFEMKNIVVRNIRIDTDI